jgi:hypothetical protein
MMEDDFYASIKLISGEEVFARVMPCIENKNINLLLNNPVTFSEIKNRNGMCGYKIEPWLKTSREDLIMVNMERVITICESTDTEMIELHQSFVSKYKSIRHKRLSKGNVTRKMGYIANIKEAKNLLEKIYKKSQDNPSI